MGRYLNPNNNKYQNFLKEKYVVDKSMLLNNILGKIEQNKRFLCCSRPRRFGKSVTAHMLAAYFSKGADSRAIFEPLKCVKDKVFLTNLNHYDTIFMDIQAQFVKAKDQGADPNKMLQENAVRELKKAYPGWIQGDENLSEALAVINAETGNEFVIIFDEWDYPIRELAGNSRERRDYIELLRMMFKNAEAQDYVRLAYLTGILPMVRSKGQSAVNNFDEYTMTDPRVSVRKRVCGSGLSAAAQCPQRPVIVVELKWNRGADTAITRIREKRYPNSLRDYYGEILLVGISYEKKTKEHTCVIECVER